jgi:hypothetical protein
MNTLIHLSNGLLSTSALSADLMSSSSGGKDNYTPKCQVLSRNKEIKIYNNN